MVQESSVNSKSDSTILMGHYGSKSFQDHYNVSEHELIANSEEKIWLDKGAKLRRKRGLLMIPRS